MRLALSILLVAASVAAQPAVELREKFAARLASIAAGVDGVVGYEIVDLTSNERVSHLERETFITENPATRIAWKSGASGRP